jgi:hypothetical protein
MDYTLNQSRLMLFHKTELKFFYHLLNILHTFLDEIVIIETTIENFFLKKANLSFNVGY